MDTQLMKGKYRAFIFLDIVPGKEKEFSKKLMRFDEVVEVHLIVGEYDIFAVLEFEIYGRALYSSPQEIISRFILDKIRKFREVKDTNTIIPTYSYTKKT